VVLFYFQVSSNLFYLMLMFPLQYACIMTWDPTVTELASQNVLFYMQLYGHTKDECLQQKHVAAILEIKMCTLLTNMHQIYNCP
jgi:hypothetical protein